MRHTVYHRHATRAPALRRLLIALLAVAYLLVGFGGEISCAEEMLPVAGSFDAGAVADEPDEGSKKAPQVVEHCYTCVPLLIPAPVLVIEPSAEPVKLSFEAAPFLVEDDPGLDTPPPKHLTWRS